MAEQLTEQHVIQAILEGDSEQYRQLVERYHRGLITHLCFMMNDTAAAEDVAQEAFIRAYDKLGYYNPAYAFSTWLYKIADRLAYRQLQRKHTIVDAGETIAELADERPSIPEQTERQLLQERVRYAVRGLPDNYQRVVNLYYWDGFSYEDIARIIGRPVGTVRTWLYRAKEQLREELHGQV